MQRVTDKPEQNGAPIGEVDCGFKEVQRYTIGSGIVYERPILQPVTRVVRFKSGGELWRSQYEVAIVVKRKD